MGEYLNSLGWHNAGGCGCTPQKYKYKNGAYPDCYFKIIPSRQTWELYEYDHLKARGQSVSLQSQYKQHIK